jgi:hypothetical protein
MSYQDNAIQARELDKASTALIDLGVNVVKKNPVKTGLYLVGLLICFLFNGFQVTEDVKIRYEEEIESVDYRGLEMAKTSMLKARHRYHSSRGWFYSCDDTCQSLKKSFEIKEKEFKLLDAEQYEQVRKCIYSFNYIIIY